MQTAEHTSPASSLNLRVGQLVEVRSAAEILAMLDKNGEYEDLPFMPEMLRYCGHRFTVASVAHKLCDTINRTGMRRMRNAVHLTGAASRCDGSAHGGCQAACLIYWKEAWLKRVDTPSNAPEPAGSASEAPPTLLPLLVANSRKDPLPDGTERYSCQATEIPRAAPEQLPFLDMTQYVQDLRSGNRGLFWIVRAFLVGLFNRVQGLSKRHLPPWLRFREAMSWGFIKGSGDRTQTGVSNLMPGELVRVKSKAEIMRTLNQHQLNRGLGFDAEMSRFCGRTARVARRVDRIIDEKTGQMLTMKNPCIVLQGLVCEGAYNASCPRAITPYWREIWLERVEA